MKILSYEKYRLYGIHVCNNVLPLSLHPYFPPSLLPSLPLSLPPSLPLPLPPSLLPSLPPSLPPSQQPGLLDVVAPLLAADTVASSCRRWRLHEQLLGAWSTLPRVLTSEQIYTKFVPALLRHIKGGVRVCLLSTFPLYQPYTWYTCIVMAIKTIHTAPVL